MRKNEDTDVKEEEDIEYEYVKYLEYLDDAKTDYNSQHNIITKEYNYWKTIYFLVSLLLIITLIIKRLHIL